MAVDHHLLDLEDLSPELRSALYTLLPLELRPVLTSIRKPSQRTHEAVHAHLVRLLTALRATVPRWLLDTPSSVTSNSPIHCEATLLFADVTDFTPITERLNALGERGNEELTHILNRFFTKMVKIASTWGGDVLAFGGDALLVAFRDPNHAATAAAAACAMRDAMTAFDRIKIEEVKESFQLAMKIGVASGSLILTHAGTQDRRLVLGIGSVLSDTDAMTNGLKGGQIRIDQHTVAAVARITQLTPQPDGSALLEHIGVVQAPPQTRSIADVSSLRISELTIQAIALATYLPDRLVKDLVAQPDSTPGVGEQRQVVSVFAHLVGVQSLADVLALEELSAAVNLVITRILEVIEGNGGVLARVDSYADGHKILALFGAPAAQEDAVYWATHTAVTLRTMVQQANAEIINLITNARGGRKMMVGGQTEAHEPLPELAVAVGLHIGQVVSGIVGSPARYEYTVMGDSVNIAARLMGKAKQFGGVLISDAVRQRLLRVSFSATEHTLVLKGVSDPVTVWAVRDVAAKPPRKVNLTTELCGRASERQRLNDVATAFQHGDRRVLILQGEAGVGKSRLSWELRKQVKANARCVFVHLPFQKSASYGLFESLLRKVYQQFSDLYPTPEAWVAALVQQCSEPTLELRAALGFLLRLPDIEYWRLGDSAEAQERTLARAVQATLYMLSVQRPLALFFEDLHRADDRSFKLLEELFRLSWGEWHEPLLICATLRPHYDAEGNDSIRSIEEAAMDSFSYGYARMKLDVLNDDDSAALLHALLPDLAPETYTMLCQRAGGNPLFLELLAASVNRTSVLRNSPNDQVLRTSLNSLDIPPELSELVVAQIDSLAPGARALTCAAAVAALIDGTFPKWLVAKIAGGSQIIGRRWDELMSAGVIVPEPRDQNITYTFHHPLFQEKAYTLLQNHDRWSLHSHIAEELDAITDRFEHVKHIDALAYHSYEGHDWQRALEYSLIVGQRARTAYDETRARLYLRRAMYLARALNRPSQEATAREGLGWLYILLCRFTLARLHLQGALRQGALGEQSSSQVESQARRYRLLAILEERSAQSDSDYARAEASCMQGLDSATALPLPNVEVVRIHTQRAEILWRWGHFDAAEQACHTGVAALPTEPAWPRERGTLLQRLGTIDGQRGNYAAAITLLEQSKQLVEPTGDKVLLAAILNNLGLYTGRIGEYGKAEAYHLDSLTLKETAHDLVGKATSLINLGDLCQIRGKYTEAAKWLRQAQVLCEQYKLTEPLARTHIVLGIVQYVQSQMEIMHATSAKDSVPRYERAKVMLIHAKTQFEQAQTIFAHLQDDYGQVDCLYRLGDIALAQQNAIAATTYGERARTLALEIESPAYESCALRVLGEALLQQEQLTEAETQLEAAWHIQLTVQDCYDQTLIEAARARLYMVQQQYTHAHACIETGLFLARKHNLIYQIALLKAIRRGLDNLET